MSIAAIYQLLNDSQLAIEQNNAEVEFYSNLLLADIVKYADLKYDRTSIENYFNDALHPVRTAEKEAGFRLGLKIAYELFTAPTFNEFTAKAKYTAYTGGSLEKERF